MESFQELLNQCKFEEHILHFVIDLNKHIEDYLKFQYIAFWKGVQKALKIH